GANAHVIVEEYHSFPVATSYDGPFLFVLSAKNEDRLREYAQQLLTFLGSEQSLALNIADLVYTLQTGRVAMEERLALEIGSLEELKQKLEYFLAGRTDIEKLYRGNIKRDKAELAALTGGAKAADNLLYAWSKGLAVDWHQQYAALREGKPRRISLPGYPFMK